MKRFFSLAAVLCCAMSMMMFTACGDDETPEPQKPEPQTPEQQEPVTPADSTKTPVYVRVIAKFHNTEDMLKYFDIKIMYQENDDEPQSFGMATPETVDTALTYSALSPIAKYPVTMKFYREVTVKEEFKDSIPALEKFDFTFRFDYVYGHLNAEEEVLDAYRNTKQYGGDGSVSWEKILDNISRGMYANIYTFAFDENGVMNFSYPRPTHQNE